jgi:hypothetical protein
MGQLPVKRSQVSHRSPKPSRVELRTGMLPSLVPSIAQLDFKMSCAPLLSASGAWHMYCPYADRSSIATDVTCNDDSYARCTFFFGRESTFRAFAPCAAVAPL